MKKMLKELKQGEWFTLKPIDNPKDTQVYIKGEYVRCIKKYSCTRFSDINDERFIAGAKEVYTEFTF